MYRVKAIANESRQRKRVVAAQVERRYASITVGCPQQKDGRIETVIGRNVHDRKKMGVFPAGSTRSVHCRVRFSSMHCVYRHVP